MNRKKFKQVSLVTGGFDPLHSGHISYFKSAKEDLLPSYVLDENDNIFHLVVTDMSDLQFGEYQKIRKREADREKVSKKNAKKQQHGGEQLFKIASSYRIESRLCCNFVFPDPPGRPMPDKKDFRSCWCNLPWCWIC